MPWGDLHIRLPWSRVIENRLCFQLVFSCMFHLCNWQMFESHKLLFSENFFAHEHKTYVLDLEIVQ